MGSACHLIKEEKVMAMTINTNISALQVENALNNNNAAMQSSMQKLSTGSNINTAADDPAGLAISQGLQAQIGGLTQAAQNVSDGVNLIQTASGALTQVSAILQQVNSLAVQAANDTNDTDSRTDIQTQVTALANELTQIGSSTNFDGVSLLSGVANPIDIQVGTDGTANSQVAIDLSTANVSTLATTVSGLTFDSAADAQASITAVQTAIQSVSTWQANLGATQNVLTSTGQSIAVNSQNLTAANSTISDADMASEMANYTKDSVLVQAGTAMLSQANQNDQLVLKLLQG
jgi:flagellin